MPAPTANIKGTFKDTKGVALAGKTVSFEPLSTPFTSGGDIVTTMIPSVILSPAGKFGDVTDSVPYNVLYPIVKGTYRVVVSDKDSFIISVPGDGGTYDVNSLSVQLAEPETLKSLVSSTDFLGVVNNTNTIVGSLKTDRDMVRGEFIVIGEGTVLNTHATLFPHWLSYTPVHVLMLGQANTGGLLATMDTNIGRTFHQYILGYTGVWGSGALGSNRLWYAAGPEDWLGGDITEIATFIPNLPTNTNGHKRYYKTSIDSAIELFVLDSNASEPDGNTQGSTQGIWLQSALAASTARFKVVAFRDAPKCSKAGYSFPNMDWPFASWGANLVIAGGAKFYERIDLGSGCWMIVYGASQNTGVVLDTFGTPITGSTVRVSDRGILRIRYNNYSLKVDFQTDSGSQADTLEILGSDLSKWYPSVNFNYSDGGLRADAFGLGLTFGSAQYSVPTGPEYFIATQRSVKRRETPPLVADVLANPWMRDSLFLVGDDPGKIYYYNEANDSVDLLVTGVLPSIHSGARPKLAAPTFTSSTGSRVAVNHTDPTADIYISINGENFTQKSNWTTNPLVYYNTPGPWWVAIMAKKANYRDSEITYMSLVAP